MVPYPTRLLHAIVLISLAAGVGCTSLTSATPTNFEEQQDASDAYLAYQRGDCAVVLDLTRPFALAGWDSGELLDSMKLVRGYCLEQSGDIKAAQEIYEALIPNLAFSFAARDARERARILRIQESDPDLARWMNEGRQRALSTASKSPRQPLERRSAAYPPVLRATGIEGHAVVEFAVTPRGGTSDPVVVESEPPFLFDGAALRAIRDWSYSPKPRAKSNEYQVIKLVFLSESPDAEAEDVIPDDAP